ncbi:hypothetical protein REMIM1_PE00194 (plasmid) [Rhizobium etli bv. mimosae str. Mim1]|nr:hypothetical protein REMIM1_PE00194 [Rhizobium etli bv. mimosae str. Mim1]
MLEFQQERLATEIAETLPVEAMFLDKPRIDAWKSFVCSINIPRVQPMRPFQADFIVTFHQGSSIGAIRLMGCSAKLASVT